MKIKKSILVLCLLGILAFAGYIADLELGEIDIQNSNSANSIEQEVLTTENNTGKKNGQNGITVPETKKDAVINSEDKELDRNGSGKTKANDAEPKVLKMGSQGEEVKVLQEKLNKFGYKLIADGIFGQGTESAVYDFQRRNKIKSNGIVDKSTYDKLDLPPCEETMYKPPNNTYASSSNSAEKFINSRNANSSTDYYIWVNTKDTKVYIFEGYNRNWKLIKNMLCTVGKSSSPTIKGTFKVGSKGASFVVKDNPKLQCNYYTQISGNYLFHTVLLYRNGKIADGRLGAKLSHGCVRLSIENAKYIHDTMPKGTSIYVS